MMPFIKFTGNCPNNVNRDAKYSVRSENNNYVVGIFYRSVEGELWYPSTSKHPELVKMVNQIKSHFNGSPGGTFYINEYKQVIVPTSGDDRNYYLAGTYENPLHFEFEGNILSGNALDLNGRPIQPGALWYGPHAGIPYILAAGGRDIYYSYEPRANVQIKSYLSRVLGTQQAARVAQKIMEIKGSAGGRFYVNEYCQMFTPLAADYGIEYKYIGKLESLDNWFPTPHQEQLANGEVAVTRDKA